MVIWDLNGLDTFPIYHPVTSILYSSNSQNVKYTMVDGVFLKYDGRLIMDEEALKNEAADLQKALIARGKGKAKPYKQRESTERRKRERRKGPAL